MVVPPEELVAPQQDSRTSRKIKDDSHNSETITNTEDDRTMAPEIATAVSRSAPTVTTDFHGNTTTNNDRSNHRLRDSIGNVYNVLRVVELSNEEAYSEDCIGNAYAVAELSNEVAYSEDRGQFLWNSVTLGLATAGTINGLLKHSGTNNSNQNGSSNNSAPVTTHERGEDDEEHGPTNGVQGAATLPTASLKVAAPYHQKLEI